MNDFLNHNDIIYSPKYKSSKDLLNWIEEDIDFNASSYMIFEDIEYKTIYDFVRAILESIKINSESKIGYNLNLSMNGDRIEFFSKRGSLIIRIPAKNSPLNIERNYLFYNTKDRDGNIIKINQMTNSLKQFIFEASCVL